MMENLGDRIRGARKKNDLTMSKLAEKIGISTSAIGSFESGKSKPSVENLLKISEICEVELDWLLKGKESSKVLNENQSKPQDNGAFGSEVEFHLTRRKELEKELEEIKKDFKAKEEKYLEIIRNLSLGKDEVTETPATVEDLINQLPIQLPVQQKKEEIAVLG